VYLERFIHGELFRQRADVTSVVHSHSPAVIPFGISQVPLRPVYHMSSFLGGGVPVFEIRDAGGPATDMLIRSPALGHALAVAMGDHSVMLMRGHGSVVAATGAGTAGVRQAVFRAVYTEQNARMEAEALRLGAPVFLNDAEAAAATKTNAGLVERPWALWRKKAMGE
jgi:HCOMODA/2-hydroxy-3-carboxy-muconic semialdehyde decarboxylase